MLSGTVLSFILLVNLTFVNQLSTSDTILDNTKFYYGKLNKYPSRKVTIEVSISHSGANHTLDLYTFKDNLKIGINCSYQNFGQLRNKAFSIRVRDGTYRFLSFGYEDKIMECHGKTTVQVYKPKNFAFSFGFTCDKKFNHHPTLIGLTFNICLYDETNDNQCSPVEKVCGSPDCSRYYSQTIFPNLVGTPDGREASHEIVYLDQVYKLLVPNSVHYNCYQHLQEFLCHVIFPECNSTSNQMTPICREA